jgi:hypothetical protein
VTPEKVDERMAKRAQLSDFDRKILCWQAKCHAALGMSVDDIAARLAVPLATVRGWTAVGRLEIARATAKTNADILAVTRPMQRAGLEGIPAKTKQQATGIMPTQGQLAPSGMLMLQGVSPPHLTLADPDSAFAEVGLVKLPPGVQHGIYAYQKYSCRCHVCREQKAVMNYRHRMRTRAKA